MNTTAPNLASLARLLRAEQLARQLSTEAMVARFALQGRVRAPQRDDYAMLAKAARTGEAWPADVGHAVLLVCEAQPFEPNLDNLRDQLLLRMLAEIGARGMVGWVTRMTVTRRRVWTWLLRQLPARPAAIVAVDVSQQQCLEALAHLAPVVQVGMRPRIASEPIPCVEHDSRWEAAALGTSAATHRHEQISFVAATHRSGGKRRIDAGDLAVLSALTGEAQNRHIAVPANLTYWVEADQDLQATGILPKILRSMSSRTLLVMSGPGLTRQVTAALAGMPGGAGASRVICRHWAAADVPVPVIGANLNQLARVALTRVLGEDHLPAEAAVLVRPVWHQLG